MFFKIKNTEKQNCIYSLFKQNPIQKHLVEQDTNNAETREPRRDYIIKIN